MTKKRVVVTGMGVISPFGQGKDSFFESIEKGETCFDEHYSDAGFFDKAFQVGPRICGKVKEWDYQTVKYLNPRKLKKLQSFEQWLLIVSAEALKDAGVKPFKKFKKPVSVIIGTDLYHLITMEDFFFQPRMEPNTPAKISNLISLHLKLNSPTFAITAGESTGLVVIGTAFGIIRNGWSDMVIAAAGSQINNCILWGYDELKILAPAADNRIKSFDKKGDGTILSEGAACLILESLDSATQRGAKIYGEVIGYGSEASTNENSSPLNADETVIQKAMERALNDANIKNAEVDYICAHANGLLKFDEAEARAIKGLYGKCPSNPFVSSIKSS